MFKRDKSKKVEKSPSSQHDGTFDLDAFIARATGSASKPTASARDAVSTPAPEEPKRSPAPPPSPGNPGNGYSDLRRVVEELKSFDVSTIKQRSDPRLETLKTSINNALANIFGRGTREYKTRAIWSLDTTPSAIGGAWHPISEVREGYQKGIDDAITMADSILDKLEEEARPPEEEEKKAAPDPRKNYTDLKRALEELKSFDVSTIRQRPDPRAKVLTDRINDTLGDIFGRNSSEYQTHAIWTLDTALPITISGAWQSLSEVREGYQKGINDAMVMVNSVLERMENGFRNQEEKEAKEEKFPLAVRKGRSTEQSSPGQPRDEQAKTGEPAPLHTLDAAHADAAPVPDTVRIPQIDSTPEIQAEAAVEPAAAPRPAAQRPVEDLPRVDAHPVMDKPDMEEVLIPATMPTEAEDQSRKIGRAGRPPGAKRDAAGAAEKKRRTPKTTVEPADIQVPVNATDEGAGLPGLEVPLIPDEHAVRPLSFAAEPKSTLEALEKKLHEFGVEESTPVGLDPDLVLSDGPDLFVIDEDEGAPVAVNGEDSLDVFATFAAEPKSTLEALEKKLHEFGVEESTPVGLDPDLVLSDGPDLFVIDEDEGAGGLLTGNEALGAFVIDGDDPAEETPFTECVGDALILEAWEQDSIDGGALVIEEDDRPVLEDANVPAAGPGRLEELEKKLLDLGALEFDPEVPDDAEEIPAIVVLDESLEEISAILPEPPEALFVLPEHDERLTEAPDHQPEPARFRSLWDKLREIEGGVVRGALVDLAQPEGNDDQADAASMVQEPETAVVADDTLPAAAVTEPPALACDVTPRIPAFLETETGKATLPSVLSCSALIPVILPETENNQTALVDDESFDETLLMQVETGEEPYRAAIGVLAWAADGTAPAAGGNIGTEVPPIEPLALAPSLAPRIPVFLETRALQLREWQNPDPEVACILHWTADKAVPTLPWSEVRNIVNYTLPAAAVTEPPALACDVTPRIPAFLETETGKATLPSVLSCSALIPVILPETENNQTALIDDENLARTLVLRTETGEEPHRAAIGVLAWAAGENTGTEVSFIEPLALAPSLTPRIPVFLETRALQLREWQNPDPAVAGILHWTTGRAIPIVEEPEQAVLALQENHQAGSLPDETSLQADETDLLRASDELPASFEQEMEAIEADAVPALSANAELQTGKAADEPAPQQEQLVIVLGEATEPADKEQEIEIETAQAPAEESVGAPLSSEPAEEVAPAEAVVADESPLAGEAIIEEQAGAVSEASSAPESVLQESATEPEPDQELYEEEERPRREAPRRTAEPRPRKNVDARHNPFLGVSGPAKKAKGPSADVLDAQIAELQLRIDQLKSFDIERITERADPRAKAMNDAVNKTLAVIYGQDTYLYWQHAITSLERTLVIVGGPKPSTEQIQDAYRKGINEAAAKLTAILESLGEKRRKLAAEEPRDAKPRRSFDAGPARSPDPLPETDTRVVHFSRREEAPEEAKPRKNVDARHNPFLGVSGPAKKAKGPSADVLDAQIAEMQLRIDQLKSFDIERITERADPRAKAMNDAVNKTLAVIYGQDTYLYWQHAITSLERTLVIVGGPKPSTEQIQDAYRKGINEAAAKLTAILESLGEKRRSLAQAAC